MSILKNNVAGIDVSAETLDLAIRKKEKIIRRKIFQHPRWTCVFGGLDSGT